MKFLYSQFKYFFGSVYIVKPKSSRSSSVEAFIVCLNYFPPPEFVPKKLTTFNEEKEKVVKQKEESKYNEKLFNFVTCGDLSGFDEE